jgi:hypothetical protein
VSDQVQTDPSETCRKVVEVRDRAEEAARSLSPSAGGCRRVPVGCLGGVG